MRPDVLEVIAEEIAGRLVDPLSSFLVWDSGRPRLDGMSRGTRRDIDREQREFDEANRGDFARLMASQRRRRYYKRNRDKVLARATRYHAEHREMERVKALARYRKNRERYLARLHSRRNANRATEQSRRRARYLALKADTQRYADLRARDRVNHRRRYWANIEQARAANRETKARRRVAKREAQQ